MAWYYWVGLLLLLAIGAYLVLLLLAKITDWGGDRTDGLENASKFSAEAEAYRGSRTPDNATMDGEHRIAPPKHPLGW